MVLKSTHDYPPARAYVLKLREDAEPVDGRFVGCLEHLVSGERWTFESFDELRSHLACLPPSRGSAT